MREKGRKPNIVWKLTYVLWILVQIIVVYYKFKKRGVDFFCNKVIDNTY